MMKRSGRILFCLACGMAWSVISYADTLTPQPPGSTNPAMRRQLILEKIKEKHAQLKMVIPSGIAPNATQTAPAPANAAPPIGNNEIAAHPAAPAIVNPVNSDTPYGSIVTRNVFALVPVPVQSVTPPDRNPPPKITLTGITTIFGPAEVLYKVAGVVKPGQPPTDESYILQEGQGEDGVEVVRIDVDKNKVTFNNNGVMQDILLTAGVASGGAAPSPSSMPAASFGGPRGIGQRPNFNNLPAALRQRLQQHYDSQNGGNPGGNSGVDPTGQSTGPNASTGFISTPAGLTGDDLQALTAAERAQYEAQGNPIAKMLPPTPYDGQARKEFNGSPPPP